jgi:uncharacterized protein YybS (DUF2232 family)
MSSLPDRENSFDPAELDEEWIPDVSDDPLNAPRQRQVRRVDPDSPIVMVETAFLASASSLLWLVNTYFPMGPILQIFFAVPIALIYLRCGTRAAWMGTVISGLLLSVLMGPTRSIQFVIPYGLLGVLLGALWNRGVSWAVSIPISALLTVLGAFFRIWLVSVLLGDDLWLYGTNQVTNFLEWGFTRLGLLIQPSAIVIQLLVFAMIVVHNLVYLFVVHLVSWYLLERLNNPIPRPPSWVETLLDND